MPVVVVTGLRQAGKSTFLQKEPGLERRRYLTLDDLETLEAARRDPEGLVAGAEALTIDEVQRAPDLLLTIKREVDRDRQPGRFLLSGSANLALLSTVSESLAGRAVALTLHPFTLREIEGWLGETPFLRRLFERGAPPDVPTHQVSDDDLLRGGLPTVCLRQVNDHALWFRGYEQTYLERDVRQISRISDIVAFRSLLKLTAFRTGQVLKVSELARDAKMNAETVGRHLGVFEASFVTTRLPPYLGNRASRVIKSPKIYVTDSGLAAHLWGIATTAALAGDTGRGALVETFVAHNLAGILEARWPQARLAYWHVQGRHEVDFVVEVGREVMAIEVKSGARPRESDFSSLRAFMSRTPHCKLGVLAHGGRAVARMGECLWSVPIGALLR
ncbi:MAG: ATP-binding protein [bacterium]|nr:ATP-binding protein [bacterium]